VLEEREAVPMRKSYGNIGRPEITTIKDDTKGKILVSVDSSINELR
jgi:hypothetical protein